MSLSEAHASDTKLDNSLRFRLSRYKDIDFLINETNDREKNEQHTQHEYPSTRLCRQDFAFIRWKQWCFPLLTYYCCFLYISRNFTGTNYKTNNKTINMKNDA